MINQDVREVLAAELNDGENLLWAEKINRQTQDLYKSWFQLPQRRKRVLTVVLLMALVGLVISFTIPVGINNWGTPSQILLYNILSSVCLYGFAISATLLVLNRLIDGRVYTIGAYGLTNKRLFELDRELTIIRHLDASRVRYVYGSEFVVIKPIGAKGSRSYRMGLLDNSTLTINYLHLQIVKAEGKQVSQKT